MLITEILLEAIHAPIALEIYKIIQDNLNDQAALQDRMQSFLRAQLPSVVQPDKIEQKGMLDFKIHPPTPRLPSGGAFWYVEESDSDSDPEPGLEPVSVPTIFAFLSKTDLAELQHPDSWGHAGAVQSLARTIVHEFIHAIQYYRANKDSRGLSYYHRGIERPRKAGKRYGKRGTYLRTGREYPGNSTEIDARAADAASDIVHRISKEPKEQQIDYLLKVISSLREMSQSLSNYKDLFKNTSLLTYKTDSQPSVKRQRTIVWNRFRKKLASHLMDYASSMR